MSYLREIQQYIRQYIDLAEPNSQLVMNASTLAEQFVTGALKRVWAIDVASTGFARELTNRAGGLAGITPLRQPFNLSKEDLVIAADHGIDSDLQISVYNDILNSGATLLLIASKSSTVYQSVNPSIFLDSALNKTPAYLSNNRFCPIDTTLNIAIAWCFIAEWINACVIRGYVPVINASTFQQGGTERVALYKSHSLFHSQGTFDVTPLSPGIYCELYLKQLEHTLHHIIHTQAPLIEKACSTYQEALNQKGTLFFKADSHLISHQFKLSGNPGFFRYLDENLSVENAEKLLVSPNVYTHLGYYTYPNIPLFFVNQKGATSVWLQGGMENNRIALKDKRVVIDQGWVSGDAVLNLPGYDIRIIPESGIIQNCLFWELNLKLLQNTKLQAADAL
ncbi:hypothetical protein [Endozoicomonas atrinae]|uniref:hypothetical protein n=1 Tax=Endozoicomonas atrinae TaxID=1333660 RepID=UPI000826DC78|nr:hypothetical protein [Endozoicomonas atrinae]